MIHKNTFKLCLGILLSFMMLLPTLAQNTKSFKGVVVDETGEPIRSRISYYGRQRR